MLQEVWKLIPEFGNYKNSIYECSTYGRIRNINNINKIMKHHINSGGYLCITLRDKTYFVHRLVAITFIDNINNKATVNHKDGIKTNNNILNLEWMDSKEQALHQYSLRENKKIGKKVKVAQYSLDNKFIQEFASIRLAAKIICGDENQYMQISSCINGDRKKALGFLWKEVKEHSIIENEIWLPLEGISDKHFISNYGRIKDINERFFILNPKETGYVKCALKGKYYNVHRLVAIYFIPNIENKEMVNHKDMNRSNNCVSNLEWVTRSENVQHAVDIRKIINNK